MKQKIKTYIDRISPSKATRLLEKNTHNRRVNHRHVEALARDMTNQAWKLNGDAIRFNSTCLLDGQHRLLAVIKSGVTIDTLVVEGLSNDVLATIDTNTKPRNLSDVLYMDGAKHPQVLSSMAKWVERYSLGDVSDHIKLTVAQSLEFIGKHPDMEQSAAFVHPRKAGPIIAPGVLAACHYIFNDIDPDEAGVFVDGLITGADLTTDSAIMTLREKFIKCKMSRVNMRPRDQMVLCIAAWNYMRANTPVTKLYMPTSYTGKVAR